tara:strand:- start:778 stop:981 length:204 start_codon:yes stop_codon:yes gene_type:complete
MAKVSAPAILDDTEGLYNFSWNSITTQWQEQGRLEVIGLVKLAPITLVKIAKRPEPVFTKVIIAPAM